MEEVDFLCGLVCSNEKERSNMTLESAHLKQEIADMKLEIHLLTFGHQHFSGSDDDIQFYTTLYRFSKSFYEFLLPSATQLNYWGSVNTDNCPSTDV